jgi:hypothetical protein
VLISIIRFFRVLIVVGKADDADRPDLSGFISKIRVFRVSIVVEVALELTTLDSKITPSLRQQLISEIPLTPSSLIPYPSFLIPDLPPP